MSGITKVYELQGVLHYVIGHGCSISVRDVVFSEHRGMPQHDYAWFVFSNGWAASVIKLDGWDGFYEIAVVNPEGKLDYTTHITDDTVRILGTGSGEEAEVDKILKMVAQLGEDDAYLKTEYLAAHNNLILSEVYEEEADIINRYVVQLEYGGYYKEAGDAASHAINAVARHPDFKWYAHAMAAYCDALRSKIPTT
jgi:hypothetical protein